MIASQNLLDQFFCRLFRTDRVTLERFTLFEMFPVHDDLSAGREQRRGGASRVTITVGRIVLEELSVD